MDSGRWPARFWTKCWASGPISFEHQLDHRVRDPNGRAYNRTAFLPERRVMKQTWADYLDRLRADEEIEPGAYGPELVHIAGISTIKS